MFDSGRTLFFEVKTYIHLLHAICLHFKCTPIIQQPVIVLFYKLYWKHVWSFTWRNIKYSFAIVTLFVFACLVELCEQYFRLFGSGISKSSSSSVYLLFVMHTNWNYNRVYDIVRWLCFCDQESAKTSGFTAYNGPNPIGFARRRSYFVLFLWVSKFCCFNNFLLAFVQYISKCHDVNNEN